MLAKLLTASLFSAICLSTAAQKNIERYYNYYWRECPLDDARFYSIERKTDSGWYRTDYFITNKKMQMAGLYEDQDDNVRNGTFYWFYPNGAIKTIGKYQDNKKVGLWLDYYQDKAVKSAYYYKDGNPTGICMSWYNDGMTLDSLTMDDSGNGVYVSWYDNGIPSSAGRYVDFDKQQGKWQYFYKNGKLSSLELYDHDKLVDKNYFDEEGNPLGDTTNNDSEPQFPGGIKEWNKYLGNVLHFPSGYELNKGSDGVVLVKGIVNDEGKIVDVEVTAPLGDAFDKIAIDALKHSPKWIPARSHNHNTYGIVPLSISFSQGVY